MCTKKNVSSGVHSPVTNQSTRKNGQSQYNILYINITIIKTKPVFNKVDSTIAKRVLKKLKTV